jgi:hypothetical protein
VTRFTLRRPFAIDPKGPAVTSDMFELLGPLTEWPYSVVGQSCRGKTDTRQGPAAECLTSVPASCFLLGGPRRSEGATPSSSI